jgi:hypothetical protein
MNATTIQTRDADRRDVKKSRIAHYFKPSVSRTTLAVASALAMLMVNAPVHAQTNGSNESAMVRLIKGLIDSGALKKDVGEALLAQAQAESLTAQQAQRQAAAPATASAAQAGDVRVPYVSQSVRNQIRDEVKQEVMAQAKTEGWATPNEMPEWTKRIQFEGDVRLRNESRLFASDNNDYTSDYNAINAGSGYDINQNNYKSVPMPNTLQSRKNIWRARARLGILATISENTKAGIRLATGGDNGPTSTTQTLGGGLGKKNIWLDQAWFSYRVMPGMEVVGGRFANPFYSHDILFSGDLNFDGIAAKFDRQLANKDVSVFGTLGVIPLEYSSDNTPKFTSNKAKSENRWLLGAQIGADWKLDDTNKLRGALAYYHFHNISGQISSECNVAVDGECNTDWSRPAFMQKGNTMMALRHIQLDATNPSLTPLPQYFGLASKFQLLDINTRWDTKVAGDLPLRLDANYIRNLAYSTSKMLARANSNPTGGIANNFTVNSNTDLTSGGNAFLLQATLGKLSPSVKNDWNVYVNYRRIEPDALPDAYNDSSFNLGGTNTRGFTLGGAYAIDTNTTLNGRWMSSRQVYGAPLAIDVLQVELNTRF